MRDFIETKIMSAIRRLLMGQVNAMLGELEYQVPLIEFSEHRNDSVVVPIISLASCERTEKERIIRLDAYSLTITLSFPETWSPSEPLESELYCYAYAGAVSRAVYDDPTLGGVVDRAVITEKKYLQPKKPNCGEGWGVVINLRITIENEQ